MNYLAEIKAFYDRLELNPLPSPAIALWHALMSIANKTGWKQEFTVAVSILTLKSGLNATAVKRARNRLEQEGFLTWKSRSGNQSASYHMISLVVQNYNKNEPQNEPQQEFNCLAVQNDIKNAPQSEPQSAPQSEPQSAPQSEPINKHKQNINKNKKEIPPISPILHFEEFWQAYPNKMRRALTETAYCGLLLSGMVTEQELVQAAVNYAEYIRITEERMYLPNNFLKKGIFEDFLSGTYQKPKVGREEESFEKRREAPFVFQVEQEELLSEEELEGEDWMEYGPGWRERDGTV